MSRNDVNQLTSLRQNPYWKPGPGRTRPRNLTGLDLQWNLNEQTAFNQTKANQLDEGPLPAAEVQGVPSQYGVNKSRFWTKPVNCTGYLPMNTANSLFKGNLPLRQAMNYAVSRQAYVAAGRPVRWQAVDAYLQPGRSGLEEHCDLQEEPDHGQEARGRSHEGREDHRLLPLGCDGERGSGPDRPTGPHQPRLQLGEHHDEGLLGRQHLRRHGQARHRCRHGRLDGLVLGLSRPV